MYTHVDPLADRLLFVEPDLHVFLMPTGWFWELAAPNELPKLPAHGPFTTPTQAIADARAVCNVYP